MPLQRALQCFLYKMLHFKIIQGEEQFHRMMENPLGEALKTPMLWNWRHGCTERFDLLGVSRECEKLPTWSSCRPGSLKKQYFSQRQQPSATTQDLELLSLRWTPWTSSPLQPSTSGSVTQYMNFMFKNIQLSKKGWKKSEMASFDHTNSTVYASFEF